MCIGRLQQLRSIRAVELQSGSGKCRLERHPKSEEPEECKNDVEIEPPGQTTRQKGR